MAQNQARGVSQVKKTGKTKPNKIYYTRDFKNIKEIADHRLNHRFDYDGSKSYTDAKKEKLRTTYFEDEYESEQKRGYRKD